VPSDHHNRLRPQHGPKEAIQHGWPQCFVTSNAFAKVCPTAGIKQRGPERSEGHVCFNDLVLQHVHARACYRLAIVSDPVSPALACRA